jgi:hypothetical protein
MAWGDPDRCETEALFARLRSLAPPPPGPLQKVIDIAGPDALRTVIHDVLEADLKADGQLRQDNVLRHVLARKP